MRTFECFSIVAALLALAACSHTEPGIRVERVPVPTPVPCVNAADLPEETPELAEISPDARVAYLQRSAEAADLRAEVGDLRALIVPGCLAVEAVAGTGE
ncbi:MAG: hypothetical protein CL955_06900 [Erythrobacteraceae bacterium]|nr:hypothetical protein [Erythrobacteraceae bacterium]